jgi:anti-sigma factor RsiW
MSDRRITFEMLNTYVDGELDAAATAEVARAVAENPMLAREVAALSRLRSAVAESVEAPPLSVPALPSRSGRRTAIAAGIAFALFVAGSVLVFNLDRNDGADWLARAWQMHRDWSIADVTAQPRSPSLLVRYAEAVPGAYVPDLSASRLSLVHATVAPFTGLRRALLAGYRGTRGCKISLLVFRTLDALGEALRPFRDGKNEAYGWRAGPLGYIIMSDGMDSGRFRLLAESVRETSRQHLPFDRETRLALRQSRDKSAPCMV